MIIDAVCHDAVAIGYLVGFAGAIVLAAYTYIVWRIARGWHAEKEQP